MRKLLWALPASAAALLAWYGCVGDESGTPPAADGGTPGSDGSADVTSSPPADGAVDANADDPKNCGAPGHDCLGGTCLAGKCQPVLLAGGQKHPATLAVDGAQIYVVNVGTLDANDTCTAVADGSLTRIDTSKSPPAVTVLSASEPCPNDLALDGASVWLSCAGTASTDGGAGFTDGVIARVQKSDGTRDVMLSAMPQRPTHIRLDATNVYWSTLGASAATLQRAPKIANPPLQNVVTIATPNAQVSGMEVDTTTLFFSLRPGRVSSIPKSWNVDAGVDAATALATGEVNPLDGFTLANNVLYWSAEGLGTTVGQIRKLDLTGSSPQTIASETGAFDVAVDASFVYWTNPKTSTVSKAPLAGGAPVVLTTLAQNANVRGIAVDATAIYYTAFNAGQVFKLAK